MCADAIRDGWPPGHRWDQMDTSQQGNKGCGQMFNHKTMGLPMETFDMMFGMMLLISIDRDLPTRWVLVVLADVVSHDASSHPVAAATRQALAWWQFLREHHRQRNLEVLQLQNAAISRCGRNFADMFCDCQIVLWALPPGNKFNITNREKKTTFWQMASPAPVAATPCHIVASVLFPSKFPYSPLLFWENLR